MVSLLRKLRRTKNESKDSRRESKARSVFRKMETATSERSQVPTLQPAVTATLSEDENEATVVDTTPTPVAVEVRDSTLATKSRRMYSTREMKKVHFIHSREMQSKQRELKKAKEVLESERCIHERELSEATKRLEESEERVQELMTELDESKATLVIVSTSLIQTQHELHEHKFTRARLWI